MTLTKERINLAISEIKTLLEQYDIDKVDDMLTDDINKIIKRNPRVPVTEEEIETIKVPVTLKFFKLYCKAYKVLNETSKVFRQVANVKDDNLDFTPNQLIELIDSKSNIAYDVFCSFIENCILEEAMYGMVCTNYIGHGYYRDLYEHICGSEKNPVPAFTTGRIVNIYLKCEFPEISVEYENNRQIREENGAKGL